MNKIVRLLLVATICFFSVCDILGQKTYVVSVGVADYAYITDLRYTEADVASFNKVMGRHTSEIYTQTGKNATHANVKAKLQQVFAKAQKDDAVVLFFSGHGFQGGFCCYDMSNRDNRGALSYKELQEIFKSCVAGRKMVFADACYSGGMRKEKKSGPSSAVKKSEVMFFLSSRTNETSQEKSNGPNGEFTRFLVRGLGGGADADGNRKITAKELFDYVHRGVTASTSNKQHPVMWGRFDNNMTILNWQK